MAKYDLGISSIEEFWDLTPSMFQSLCKRRNISIRYDRYAAAMVAASVYNVNRASVDDPIASAFDWIRSDESAAKREKIRKGEQKVKRRILALPMLTSRAKYLDARLNLIAELTAEGYDNPEELFDRCWPTLKPTAEDIKP